MYKNEQNAVMDEIITKTEIIHKYAQETYKRLTKPAKGYQFRPVEDQNPLSYSWQP